MPLVGTVAKKGAVLFQLLPHAWTIEDDVGERPDAKQETSELKDVPVVEAWLAEETGHQCESQQETGEEQHGDKQWNRLTS